MLLKILGVIGIIVVVAIIVGIYLLCVNSGRISEQEERMGTGEEAMYGFDLFSK